MNNGTKLYGSKCHLAFQGVWFIYSYPTLKIKRVQLPANSNGPHVNICFCNLLRTVLSFSQTIHKHVILLFFYLLFSHEFYCYSKVEFFFFFLSEQLKKFKIFAHYAGWE